MLKELFYVTLGAKQAIRKKIERLDCKSKERLDKELRQLYKKGKKEEKRVKKRFKEELNNVLDDFNITIKKETK